jgi:hypothetical protein
MAVIEDNAECQLLQARLWNRVRCTDERLSFYVTAVYHLWMTVSAVIANNRTATHIQIFAIGTLYMIQHGFAVDGNCILPVDDWLRYNLPLVSELVEYGFPKRFVTMGRNTLLEAFKQLVVRKKLKRETLKIPTCVATHTQPRAHPL